MVTENLNILNEDPITKAIEFDRIYNEEGLTEQFIGERFGISPRTGVKPLDLSVGR